MGMVRIFVVMCDKFSRDVFAESKDAQKACGKFVHPCTTYQSRFIRKECNHTSVSFLNLSFIHLPFESMKEFSIILM
jgi:hypothetical protein